jgi:hypothetical protein
MSVVNKIVPSGFRYALYTVFGLVGAAGVAIAGSQGQQVDLAVNGAVVVAMVALAALDARSQASQVEATKLAMQNKDLGLGMYSEDGAKINLGTPESPTEKNEQPKKRIQTAAELFSNME